MHTFLKKMDTVRTHLKLKKGIESVIIKISSVSADACFPKAEVFNLQNGACKTGVRRQRVDGCGLELDAVYGDKR